MTDTIYPITGNIMHHISYVLEDEYHHLLQQRKQREQAFKVQSLRKKESAEQSAETRHDNFDFEDAERQQDMIGGKLREIDALIHRVKILCLDTLQSPPDKVRIGTTVCLSIKDKEYTYVIGGAPTIPGRVSYQSPLGRALLDAKVGDIIRFLHDKQEKHIRILSLS